MDKPIFTKRLDIHPLETNDAEAVFQYRSDAEISRYQNWEPESAGEVEKFISGMPEMDTPGQWFQLGLFLLDSGELCGDIGIHVQAHDQRQVEVGITLAPEFQRRGLASEALKAALGYLFSQLGKHRVFGSVDPRNLASMALMERIGMRKEAHFVESYWFKGTWADDVIFGMLKREYNSLVANDLGEA